MTPAQINTLADALIEAYDQRSMLRPITASEAEFDVPAAYAVLQEIERRRCASGWRVVGRKIGFTNRTIWTRYGVNLPMWAHVFAHTVTNARDSHARLHAADFVQPRLEPEVVFGLRSSVPADGDIRAALAAAEWIAPDFEIVQSHFPDWKFQAADCTAAFGLHGALIVGEHKLLDDALREELVELLPRFQLTLSSSGEPVDRGVGANVLDSPAHALLHLARVLAAQPFAPPLHAGELVTTGTITDAWPVRAGEAWSSDYGTLRLHGLQIEFE